MARLSYMKQMIESYLKVKGDKEVISIGTCHGGDDEYVLNLADIYQGYVGGNPYTGRDDIYLKRDGLDDQTPDPNRPVSPEDEPDKKSDKKPAGPNLSLKAVFDLEEELRRDKAKGVQAKLTVLWGALSVLQRAGTITMNQVKALWTEFALELMGLE